MSTPTATPTRPSDSTARACLTNSTTADPARLTSGTETIPQAYVLPIPDGWGVVTYGDPIVPDDEVLSLPYTDAMPYWQVVERFQATPAGRDATVDGWPTLADLRACEPELAHRIWGPASRSL
jgi:hypothetical protein